MSDEMAFAVYAMMLGLLVGCAAGATMLKAYQLSAERERKKGGKP